MGGIDILRMDIGFYIEIVLQALLQPLCFM